MKKRGKNEKANERFKNETRANDRAGKIYGRGDRGPTDGKGCCLS
jgi:hypothetical protein